MWTEVDMSLWQGRIDTDSEKCLRWHQAVAPLLQHSALTDSTVLLGFACDEGVRRNQGRVGAADGPDAIRRALANLAYGGSQAIFDAGTVACVGDELEQAQAELAQQVEEILQRGGKPIVLGGGHEMAWGSYLGVRHYLGAVGGRLGIINFDAHFDLRSPAAGANSGTPFRQIAESCEAQQLPFHYLVLGVNPAVNSQALFDYAQAQGVQWFEDTVCTEANLDLIADVVESFVAPLDYLYLSICLDAFPVGLAPGVSAPGVPGMCPYTSLRLLEVIIEHCRGHGTQIVLLDIAEMNPTFDRDNSTARWAARLVHEYLRGG